MTLQTTTRPLAPRATHPRVLTSGTKPLWLRLLDRIAAADAHYRESQKLRRMDDARLRDMGIARTQIDEIMR